MHALSYLILTVDTDGGLGRLPAPGQPADRQCRGSQLPSGPCPLWPGLSPLHMQGRLPPGAHPSRHRLEPLQIHSASQTISSMDSATVCQDMAALHHHLLQQQPPSQQASGPPRADPPAPQVSVPGGPENVLLLANSRQFGCCSGEPTWRPTVFPNTGGGCYHSLYRWEAHHRFQLITDFSLHDLLRGKEPRRKEANCPLSRTYLSSAVGINHSRAWGRLPTRHSWPSVSTPRPPVAVESWMWTASCSSSLYIRTWGFLVAQR